jgi:signal transduction histidine kinase
MNELKKYIMKRFIIIVFLLCVVNSMIDSLFNELTKNVTNKCIMVMLLIGYFLIAILSFIAFSTWFMKLVNKKICDTNTQINKNQNMLFANMIHDLKTPITTIMGFSKALNDGEILEEQEKKNALNSVYTKSIRVNELINLFFAYSKLDASDYDLKLEEQNICRIIKETIASYYEGFEEKCIEVDIDIPGEAIIGKVDYIEISRAFSNLLVNAYTHNDENSKVLISVDCDKYVRIIIADNGKDISADKEEEIFEPFVCEDESRNSKNGSGLGLSITKKIVEKHGGRIYIDRNLKGYTKAFVIEL